MTERRLAIEGRTRVRRSPRVASLAVVLAIAVGAAVLPAAPASAAVIMAVDPATDLLDGQVVRVRADGLAGPVYISECHQSCRYVTGPVEPMAGAIDVDVVAHRRVGSSWWLHDCASAPGYCSIELRSAIDFSLLAAAALDFDETVPLSYPEVAVSPATTVPAGTSLTVSATGFEPADGAMVRWCTSDDRCSFTTELTVGPDGSFTQPVVARARLAGRPGDAPVDCSAPGACRIEVLGSAVPPVGYIVRTEVTVTAPATSAATASVDPSTDVRDAQVLAVDGSGWIGSALVDVSVCARTDAVRCDAVAQVKSGIDGRLRGDLVARRKTPLGVDCAPMPGDCWYRFEDGLTDDVADVPFTLLASSMPRLLPPRVLRVREGDGESRVVTLAIHLDRPAEQRAVVTWLWERSDAETEARLLEAAVIPRGQRTGVLRFLVSGDRIDEPLEYYEVGLGGSNVLTLGAVVRLEIVDDDARPELRVGDAAQLEGDKVRGLCVPVRLDRQSERPIGVWIVAGGGTATSGVDYEGTVVGSYGTIIEPYTTRALVCVSGLGDRRREADETVGIVAYSAPRTTLVDAVGLATIVDDD